MDKAWGAGFVCQWFVGDKLEYGTFSEASLELVDGDAETAAPDDV